MGKFIRNLIEYQGVDIIGQDDYMVKESNTFKQTTIDVELRVPCQKPDIEQVVKVTVKKVIDRYTLVKTPKGISEENQEITGYKLLVMGDIIIKVQYVADDMQQSMHSFHVTVPFCEYMVMPHGFSNFSIVTPEIYIEDVYVRQQDCRSLFGNVTMLTMADIC